MKYIYSVLLVCISAFALHGQVTKTIHQTFHVKDAAKVNINVVAKDVEVRPTQGSRVMVETTVNISAPRARLLDYLANSGRYDLVTTLNDATAELTIASKKTNGVIMVKGEECREELTYILYIPEQVAYVNNSTIETPSKE